MANPLADDIRNLLSLLDQALEKGRVMTEQRREAESQHPFCIVVTDPKEENSDPVRELLVCLEHARRATNALFDRLCSGPLAHYLTGALLSREEFFLLASLEVWARTPWGNEYEVFRMFHYEDSEGRHYINLGEAPHVGQIPPQEIMWNQLRPEQRDFFERTLPTVAVQFRRGAQT